MRCMDFLVACALSTPHQMSILYYVWHGAKDDSLILVSLLPPVAVLHLSCTFTRFRSLHFKCMNALHMPHIYLFKQNVSTQICRHAKNGQHQPAAAANTHRSIERSNRIGSKVSKYYFLVRLFLFMLKSLYRSFSHPCARAHPHSLAIFALVAFHTFLLSICRACFSKYVMNDDESGA